MKCTLPSLLQAKSLESAVTDDDAGGELKDTIAVRGTKRKFILNYFSRLFMLMCNPSSR